MRMGLAAPGGNNGVELAWPEPDGGKGVTPVSKYPVPLGDPDPALGLVETVGPVVFVDSLEVLTGVVTMVGSGLTLTICGASGGVLCGAGAGAVRGVETAGLG